MKDEFVILQGEISIKEAIQLIARSKHHTAFTLGPDGKYEGTISINDLRRLILSGVNETDMLKYHPPSGGFSTTEEDLKNEEIISNICSDLTLQGIEHIPVLDATGQIIDVFSITELRRLFDGANIAVPTRKRTGKILIVGGAGYLGSVLCANLLERGYAVRVLDNFLYGRHSLDKMPFLQNMEVIEGDLRNIHTCVSALDDVHAVVLLAAIVGDPASRVRPRETIETNVIAAQALAAACRHQCIDRFLYASTCSVYGLGENLLDEESDLQPVSLYARTKIASEKMILSMGDDFFAPTILRMGTLYGYSPRMRFDLVVNTMTMHARTERKIRVFGGKQWRPLVSVQDAARAYIRCLESDIAKVGNQVFNIGCDEQNYQVEQIAQIISETIGDVAVQHDNESLDSRDYRVSFKKASNVLEFQARDTVAQACRVIYSNLEQGLIPDPSQKIYYNHFFDVAEE
jgi:nucleoside-diphosphate-sugar epimerase